MAQKKPRVKARTTRLGEAEVDIVTESQTAAPAETDEAKAQREKTEKTLARARRQFKTSFNATEFFREQAQLDSKFRVGTWGTTSYQWPPEIQAARAADQRPCMTINRMPGFIRQVTNKQRAMNLRIRVKPVDDKGDPKLAEVIQGIIRNIETNSFADRAYNMGGDKQCEIGLGWIRIVTEWANQKDFRVRIRIEREKNPLSVYYDVSAQRADFSDGNYLFKVTDIDESEYQAITGSDEDPPKAATLEAFEGAGDQTGDWFPNGKIRIAEWFSREPKGPRVRKALLSDGTTINYPTDEQKQKLDELGITIKKERWFQETQIVLRKIDALHIHEESVWAADMPGFVPVLGDEYEIEGVKDFRGVVRDAKDAGRGYNVQVSAMYELIGMGAKAPAIGYRGQFGAPDTPMRRAWENVNKKPLAFLEVEPIDIDGKIAPLPQKASFSPDIAAVVLGVQQSDEDYKTLAGFRDASLGERGPQESGRAIKLRQDQDQLGSSHYMDNLRFALCAVGRQLIQLIRVHYDEPTVMRITGADGREKSVMVYSGADKDPRNEQFLQRGPDGQPIPFTLPEGVKEIYDLSVGEFDVEVSASPDDGTRREEDAEFMGTIMEAMPPEMAVNFLDLFFIMRDTPVARQLAERAKKMLPKQLQDDGEGGQTPIPPEVQQEIATLHQQAAEAIAMVQQLQQQIATDQAKLEAQALMKREELEAKERIEAMKHRADIVLEEIRLKGEKAMAVIEAEIERMDREDQQRHELRLKNLDHAEHVDDHKRAVRTKVIDAVLAPKDKPKPPAKAGAKK